MNDIFPITRLDTASSTNSTRQGSAISLIVLHSDPRTTTQAIAFYTAPDAAVTPHYYIDAAGQVMQLVDEDRAAHHSGLATWDKRRRNIDRISIGIVVEHTPGMIYTSESLSALYHLIEQLCVRHSLTPDALVFWEAIDQGQEGRYGLLTPITLPPVPTAVDFGAVVEFDTAVSFGVGAPVEVEDEVPCCPPEPPAPTPLPGAPVLGGGLSFAPESSADSQASNRLWEFLTQETYRHRGGGFQSNWAFHRFAPKHDLGAPLASVSGKASEISFNRKMYGFQVFGRDTIFNEIPQWTAIQSLNALLNSKIPSSGLERLLLEATYVATGQVLHDDWKFHQIAVAEQLGPPLSGSYTVTLDGQKTNLQVFAGDTLYCFPPQWGDVRKLSDADAGALRDALWAEAYKVSASAYDPGSAFHQQAVEFALGTPLTGVYQVDFEGNTFTMQVFADDTLYAGADNIIQRLSALPKPDIIANFKTADTKSAAATQPVIQPSSGSQDDATSDKQPTFSILPIAGQPRISQFYGYTKYSKRRTDIYKATQARHSGLDFAVPDGTPLLSVGYGLVLCAGQGCPFGANRPGSIVVRYGSVYAVYGHARSARVRKGQLVKPGDVLGESGTFVGPHLHFELRPVPQRMLGNHDPSQSPMNPGAALNPINFFTSDLMSYFEQQYGRLRGTDGEFCVGSLHDQPDTTFGAALDTRPCTN